MSEPGEQAIFASKYNFLKSVGRNSKKFNDIITEIVKKFGVHSCIFQSTAGDQYQGVGEGAKMSFPVQIGLSQMFVH